MEEYETVWTNNLHFNLIREDKPFAWWYEIAA